MPNTNTPRAETTALLNTAAAGHGIRYGRRVYRVAIVGKSGGFSMTETLPRSSVTYMCHVAIDGSIRLSDSERFGEFLPA